MNTPPTQDITDTYPLSPLQQGMLFDAASKRNSGVDIEQVVCSLRETLDLRAFRAAWERVVSRHSVLRTSFRWEQLDEPLQDVHREVSFAPVERDWTTLSAPEQEAELGRYLAADRQLGFNLSEVPNFRLMIARLAEDNYFCVWTFHHILLDGRSIPTVLQMVFSIYDSLRRGEDINLPASHAYRNYIAWLQQQDWSKSEAFWRKTLKGFAAPTALRISRSTAQSDESTEATAEKELRLSGQSTSVLKAFASANGLTLNMLVQGAWAILLSRYSGEDDVLFGTVRACRNASTAGAESTVGTFINTVPFRVAVNPDKPVLPWLHQLRDQEFELRDHEHTPMVKIQQWSEIRGRTALFDSLFMYDNSDLNAAVHQQPGVGPNREFHLKEQVRFPLVVQAYGEDQLLLRILYNRAFCDDVSVARMLGHIQSLLEGMVDGAARPIGHLPLVTEAEKQQLLFAWNNTKTDYPRNECIHTLFEQQAARTPEAVALLLASSAAAGQPDKMLTYGELNSRANRLARHLRELGVGVETPVGVFLERSVETVIAILAILKAGGAYVPLDPSYPRARLAFMLKDTATPVLLTRSSLAKDLPDFGGQTVLLDTDWATIARRSDANCPNPTSADRLAYVIYTSGSTGNPKGVCVIHRGVVRLVKETNYVRLTENEVFLQFAPISFDASTFEIWASLLNGGRLVVFPPHLPTLEQLGQVIRDYRVTVLWLTASLFREMVDKRIEDLRGVGQLLAGGEALSPPHVRKALETLLATQIINGYGPTENTTFTCCHAVGVDSVLHSVPIGRPIANTTVYILDRQLQPTPIGVPGEMYTGGDGLAIGYLNAPELTEKKFIPNPFSADPCDKLYRVGDLVRYLPSGEIEFLGRIDNQVKIRGFRIELGEIEGCLAEHPAVQQAAVIVREDARGNKSLVAYLVVRPELQPTVDGLRSFVKERLPDYMVPSAFVFLSEIPLTSNGKVNRKALPEPTQTLDTADEKYVTPRTPGEEKMRKIWSEVLGIDRIGIHDDFFSLGGHSLTTLSAISRINDRFGLDLQPAVLFEHPTIAALCALVDPTSRCAALAPAPAGPAQPAPIDEALADLALLAAIAARPRAKLSPTKGKAPYRMRESWICRWLLAPSFRIRRRSVRRLLQWSILKLEGGPLFTVTLRKLYAKHFELKIGDYSEVCFDVDRMQAKTTIGRYTGIYPTVVIQNADHPRNTISTHSLFYHPVYGFAKGYPLSRMEVEIGNDVWIGHNAIILYPTKRIGDGAVIAVGSVVIEDVPPYAIVGGYPARVLRYRFSKEIIEKLLKSRWWEASLEELEPVKGHFAQPLEGGTIR